MTDSEMNELKSSVPVKQETNVFHQTSLKNRAINNTQHYESKNGHRISLRNPNIVIIDSCEYISWGHGLAHKGDCKYCRKYFDSLINAKN